jgi:DNA-binding MarR family transcriptional regulator
MSELFINDVNKIYRSHKIHFDASWFPVFYLLSESEEVSIRNISDTLHISHSAASQMVSNLQEKGLVKSVVSKKDARHKVVTFTAKGEKLLHKVQPVWNAMEKAMEELGKETAEGRKMLNALIAFEDSLKEKSVFERIEQKLKQ